MRLLLAVAVLATPRNFTIAPRPDFRIQGFMLLPLERFQTGTFSANGREICWAQHFFRPAHRNHAHACG
jgi:hypothetical protein